MLTARTHCLNSILGRRYASAFFRRPATLPVDSGSDKSTSLKAKPATSAPLFKRPGTASSEPKDNYDLVIIGGGSGGLACSKEARKLGATTAVLDFVTPTPHNTKWGLGGTCVNVGCIPKKLMHHASLLGEFHHDAANFGWRTSPIQHDWPTLVENVQQHIKSLNFGYRTRLRTDGVDYLNAHGSFAPVSDSSSNSSAEKLIRAETADGSQRVIKAKNVAIAVGGRPRLLDIPGAELAITSDDIFSMKSLPGTTLIIGAGYVALECAGFLAGLGVDTTVMARSIFLRGFDRDMADKAVGYMQRNGTKFIHDSVPTRISRDEASGKLRVDFAPSAGASGEASHALFDTVLTAAGRDPCTSKIGLDNVGVKTHKSSHKVLVDEFDATNVAGIFAIGDVAHGRPELTPTAIHAGKLLARRIFDPSSAPARGFDYFAVPTTVFTPLEYACVGLSEERAIERHGEENIEVYHSHFTPLDWNVAHRETNACYIKLVCERGEPQRVLGVHYLGPNAGEVMQGFALAYSMGATRQQFVDCIGIHPTCAEEILTLDVTKRSGLSAEKTGC